MIKPNWDIFRAKFSENLQDNFEWFCYLLFSKEYNQPYGIHRYKNQSGIETDPIEVGNEVIGFQSKFYEDSLSKYKEELLGTLTKTKQANQDITKIILYTNSEWGPGRGTKEPQAKINTEVKAKELNIDLVWRTRSYFESPFVCQEQRDISRYFFELDSKWELTNIGFKDTLRYCYLKNFKTISLLDEKKKYVSDIFINLAIIKEQEEKKDNPKLIKREPILNSYEEIHKPKEPIAIKELINTSKKSLIYGKAGVGKTTLCKYIAYIWAKGESYQKFDYVIYISLREWKNKGLKGAIKDNYYSQDEEKITLDIKANNSQILFLFDGYDELDNDRKKILRDEIEHYCLSHYIITTRPYGYQKSDFRVDEYFETIGFTDEDVEKYINDFFKNSQDKAKSLKAYLQNNISIKQIGYIPLMLEMICLQWEQKELSESLTMTELYTQVVESMLKKHSKNEEVYEWENREEIKELLGKIAFETLIKQSIVFDGKLIRDTIGKDSLDFFKKSIINSGFLKSDRKDKSLLGNNFEFLHLTFQEYFSALYVSKLSKEEQSKIIRDWKFYPHMQMFFAFLGGLIKDKEFLLREIENEPKDLIGVYHFKLLTFVLENIKENQITGERKKIIFNKFFYAIKSGNSFYYEKYRIKIKYISHIVNDDFMQILIEKNKSENIEVEIIVKELLESNNLNFSELFIKYLKDKTIEVDFIEKLLFVLQFNSNIAKQFNVKDLIKIFLEAEDNSKIQKYMISILIKIGKKSNTSIVKGFIEKFDIIKRISKNKALNFLVVNAQDDNRIKVKSLLLKELEENLLGEILIVNLINAYLLMRCKDNKKIKKILLDFIRNSTNDNFKAFCAISFLELDEEIDEYITIFIELIKNENINLYKRLKISSYIMFRGLDEIEFRSIFFELLEKKEIKEKLDIRNIIFNKKLLSIQHNFIYEQKFIDTFIKILKESSLNYEVKRKITLFIFDIKMDNELVNIFLEILKNEKIDNSLKENIAWLLVFLMQFEPNILNEFVKLVKDNYAKEYIAKYIVYGNLKNTQCIKLLQKIVLDKDIYKDFREKSCKKLYRLSKAFKEQSNNIADFLGELDDLYIKELCLKEEKKQKIQRKKSNNETYRRDDIDSEVFALLGGKPVYTIKFNKNKQVTKEIILNELSKAKKLDDGFKGFADGRFVKALLSSLDVLKYKDILCEIIEDNSTNIEDINFILEVMSGYLDDTLIYEKFKELYFYHNKRYNVYNQSSHRSIDIRVTIINAFIKVKKIEFIIELLKNHYDNIDNIIQLRNIIYFLQSQGEKVQNQLIQIAKTNEKLKRELLFYGSIKFLLKAYDYGIIESIEILKKRYIKLYLPLYINKKNQLSTIENGEEISTEKEVNESILKYFPNAKDYFKKIKFTSKARI